MRYLTPIVMFSIFIISCNSLGLPTEEMALKKLSDKQTPANKNLFQFTDFKKTNGVKGNIAGQDFYEMDYEVKKVALQDIHEFVFRNILDNMETIYLADTSKGYLLNEEKLKNGDRFARKPTKSYKKGDVIEEVKSKIHFIKKENGWE